MENLFFFLSTVHHCNDSANKCNRLLALEANFGHIPLTYVRVRYPLMILSDGVHFHFSVLQVLFLLLCF